jgi:hypothetical protein
MVVVVAHELCRPVKDGERKGELVDVTLSRGIAQLYLSGLAGNWGLSLFRGISTAPILEDDGSIRGAHGYDQKSGLWCHNVPKVAVIEHPTHDDAAAALARLRHYFRTFPWADSERLDEDGVSVTDLTKPPGLDESIFLVALLTAVTRQSLELAPGVLCGAPSISGSGTGKGLIIKAMVIVASGIRPSAFTGGHDREELDKRITAALTEARPAMFLDNLNGQDLKSDILASALTENPAMVRVMGHTKNVPLHTRTFIGITGNGVQIAEDMARRMLNVHLDAKMENPEQRPFAPGFLDRVHGDRAKLLSDALTIWRWGRQTGPQAGLPIGSYEQWAQWCRDPLLALGCRDPVDRITEIKASDPFRTRLLSFYELWWSKHQDQMVKANDLDDELKEIADGKATKRGDGSLNYNRQRVVWFLTHHVGTYVGGYTLVLLKDTTSSRPPTYFKLKRG